MGRRHLLGLRHKRAESTVSLADTQPPSISDQSSTPGSASWFRVPKKEASLTSVNEQIDELLKTQSHIITQLTEVQRLRQLKEPVLDPTEMVWIDGTISDVEDATRDVAILLEPTRVEKATSNGKLSLMTQIRWVHRDSQRARDKKQRLLACHSSLMAVLGHLQRVKVPERIAVHELGTDILELGTEFSSKSVLSSSLSLQDSVDGFYEPGREGRRDTKATASLNKELYDMLAWRRSKGAAS